MRSPAGYLALALVGLAAQVGLLLWFPGEAKRAGIEPWWPYAVATMGGVCFAFPLLLSARARRASG